MPTALPTPLYTTGWSLAHGAGRKWARSEARLRMRERLPSHQLVQTPLGGRVICEERDLCVVLDPPQEQRRTSVLRLVFDTTALQQIAKPPSLR